MHLFFHFSEGFPGVIYRDIILTGGMILLFYQINQMPMPTWLWECPIKLGYVAQKQFNATHTD